MEIRTKKFLYYIYFILQFLTIIALLGNNKIDYAIKLDYIRDVTFFIVIIAIYIFIENKYRINVSNYIRGCVLILLLLHTYAGKYLNFYLTLAIFDKILHVFGIYSLTLFCYSIMGQFTKISFSSKLNKFIFITTFGFSLGALFEIVEFIGDITINPRIHNQPDLTDTDLDLIADVVGALIAGFHVCFANVKLKLLEIKS